jgi:RNA polymerase sigma-70 factor (ECF subfamily)
MDDTSAPGGLGAVNDVDDWQLVAAAQRGDAAAMEQLLARHFSYVDTLCRRMMRNSFDAEDARQDALFQAARRITTFDARSAFRTWLHTVTKNICLNKIRSQVRDRQTPYGDVVGDIGPTNPTNPHDRIAERLDVESALAAINPVFHDAVVLWFMFDFSYEQIADALGIPLNTVRSRLRRGRHELAQLLREPLISAAVSKDSRHEPGSSTAGLT